MRWRRQRQPTPVLLPEESQGWGSLVGCCLWVAQSRTLVRWLSSSSRTPKGDLKTPISSACLIAKCSTSTTQVALLHPCMYTHGFMFSKTFNKHLCFGYYDHFQLHKVVQFSSSVVSDSLWPHGLQHTRPPCPSPTPGVYSNSCLSSQWCHPTISSSVVPFSSLLQSFPASGSFLRSQLFASGGQSIGVSASASVLPVNSQDLLPLGWTAVLKVQGTLKGLFQHHSSKALILLCSAKVVFVLKWEAGFYWGKRHVKMHNATIYKLNQNK